MEANMATRRFILSSAIFGLLSLHYLAYPQDAYLGKNPPLNQNPDQKAIWFITNRLVLAIQLDKPELVSFALTNLTSKDHKQVQALTSEMSTRNLEIAIQDISILNDNASVMCEIKNAGKVVHEDLLVFQKQGDRWLLTSSEVLLPLLALSLEKESTPKFGEWPSTQILSTITLDYVTNMLIPKKVTGTNLMRVTENDVVGQLQEPLFSAPRDMQWGNNSTAGDTYVGIFLDEGFQRVVVGLRESQKIISYGDKQGEYPLSSPKGLAISPDYEIYVALPVTGEVVQLALNYQTQTISLVQVIQLPNIKPQDIVYDRGAFPSNSDDRLWILDSKGNKIVQTDRQFNILRTVTSYSDENNDVHELRHVQKIGVYMNSWLTGEIGVLSLREFMILKTNNQPALMLSGAQFESPSRLTAIGLEPYGANVPNGDFLDSGFLITDEGRQCVHKFTVLGYVASFRSTNPTGSMFFAPEGISAGPFRNQAGYLFFNINVIEPYGPNSGIQEFYPGADALNLSVDEVGSNLEFHFKATNESELILLVVNPNESEVVLPNPLGQSWVSAGEYTITQPKSAFQGGTLRFRVKVKPYYNNYYHDYIQDWTVREIEYVNFLPASLYSPSSQATATNNQRKIDRSAEGVFCLVYESGNAITLSTSTDASTWYQDYPVSNEEYPYSKYPSISISNNIAQIVWQNQVGVGPFINWYILLREYNIVTDSWGPIQRLLESSDLPEENYEATPVIAGGPLSRAVLWRQPDGLSLIEEDNQVWSSPEHVPGTHGNCSYPSIVKYQTNSYGICWEDRNTQTINYVEALWQGSSWSFTNAAQVSPIGWYSNQRLSMAFGGFNKVSIAWQSIDNVVEGVSVHVRQKTYAQNNWGNVTSYSIPVGGVTPHPAIGSYGANGKLSLVWNVVNDVYVATYNGSCWSAPGILATGANGGTECSINNATQSLLAALWRKPNGGISITTNGVNPNWECGAEEESIAGKYSVVGDSSVVPVPYRLNRHGLVEIHRAIGSSNKSVRGTMAFEIAGMKLVTPEGVQTLEYENLASLPNGRGELSSKPFTVSNANSQLVFAGAAYGKRLAIPEDSIRSVAQPIALVKLKEHADGNPRAQVWRLPFSSLSATQDSTFGEFREFTVDLAEYVGKELYVEVEMLGRARRVAPLIDDDYLILPGEMQMIAGNSFAKAVDKTLPTTYNLYQNYPNPFNPTTTIRFDLPEAQIVSLKVFNVLGQQVRELANTLYEAGEHSVVADFTNLPSGMYFYSINAGSFTDVKKLLLIR